MRGWWQDLAAGRRTRSEASVWAESQLEQNLAKEELVIQGLLFLQAADLTPGAGDSPVHSGDPDASYLVFSADIGTALESWEAELRRYDEDPDAWTRDRLRRAVTHHATWRGVDAARKLGGKLVARDLLTAQDVVRALDEQQAPGRSGD